MKSNGNIRVWGATYRMTTNGNIIEWHNNTDQDTGIQTCTCASDLGDDQSRYLLNKCCLYIGNNCKQLSLRDSQTYKTAEIILLCHKVICRFCTEPFTYELMVKRHSLSCHYKWNTTSTSYTSNWSKSSTAIAWIPDICQPHFSEVPPWAYYRPPIRHASEILPHPNHLAFFGCSYVAASTDSSNSCSHSDLTQSILLPLLIRIFVHYVMWQLHASLGEVFWLTDKMTDMPRPLLFCFSIFSHVNTLKRNWNKTVKHDIRCTKFKSIFIGSVKYEVL